MMSTHLYAMQRSAHMNRLSLFTISAVPGLMCLQSFKEVKSRCYPLKLLHYHLWQPCACHLAVASLRVWSL